jgi:hypothetical protein
MAKFNMVVSHGLPPDDALRRVRGEIENLKRQYGDRISNLWDNWDDNTYAFGGLAKGFTVSGVMMVKPFQVEIHANLPWLAMPIKGRIEMAIRERLSTLLA